ncbi:cytochrome b-c1 complex subunit rieske-1 mitochondrial [Phtheirospermum japonicum]|uniref:Cytochrome b-c1 complex subunit rieske-1 mitochondrial n=1 Tax=Phtheirospermum japonicum TaxID=374723 RepID=A0A830CGX3_9LAMI|nr:cytochrome b-c1 complex subunit rieske-1 mitochondrial [Phtheirospermum japonicum]
MLRVAGRRLSSLSWRSGQDSPAVFVFGNPFPAVDSSSNGRKASVSSPAFSFSNINFFPDQIKGFSSSVFPTNDLGLYPDIPATLAAIKNPSPKISYDEHNHEHYPVGDPSKRAFAYFVLTGGRFVYASLARLLVYLYQLPCMYIYTYICMYV